MEKKIKIQVRDLNLYYGQNHALHGVNMDIKRKQRDSADRTVRMW